MNNIKINLQIFWKKKNFESFQSNFYLSLSSNSIVYRSYEETHFSVIFPCSNFLKYKYNDRKSILSPFFFSSFGESEIPHKCLRYEYERGNLCIFACLISYIFLWKFKSLLLMLFRGAKCLIQAEIHLLTNEFEIAFAFFY